MRPHLMTALAKKFLAELMSILEADRTLLKNRRLKQLELDLAVYVEVLEAIDLPRSQAIRAAMRVAADGLGRVPLTQLVRAIAAAAVSPGDDVVQELLDEKKVTKGGGSTPRRRSRSPRKPIVPPESAAAPTV